MLSYSSGTKHSIELIIIENIGRIENDKSSAYLLAPTVLPGNPFHSVSGIAEPIITGKLLAVPVGMTTLGADQSQEVEFAQVYLQETGTHITQ